MIRSNKLRASAREAPHCFGCFKPNPNGDLLCLAHRNDLRLGRGAYHKTPDIFGAILCKGCHDLVDGRSGYLTKDEKREKHQLWNERTIAWWWENGYITVAA